MFHGISIPSNEALIFSLSTDSNEKKIRAHKEEEKLSCQAKSAVLVTSLPYCAALSKT